MDRTDIESLISTEVAVICKLLEINSAIESHHKHCNIAKTTGAGVSAAGVVSTIAGVCLAPTTGGMSLALTAGGIGAGIAGGATSIGTDIVSHFRYKKYAAELEQALKQRLEAYHAIGLKISGALGQATINGSDKCETNGTLVLANTHSSAPIDPKDKKFQKPKSKKDGQVFSVPATTPAIVVLAGSKCATAPQKGALCVAGFKALQTGMDSASKIYDTSKILQFLYLNREIYSITNLSASLLAQNQVSGLVLGTIRQSLNKGLVKLGARIGLDGLKVGARTLLIGLGVVGIAWDAYGLVKTWSNKPEMWKEVQEMVLAIQEKINQLELFLKA